MPLDTHFNISAWDDKPREEGCLAKDNYDPTYGDGGVGLGTQVYLCLTCGVGVLHPQVHSDWHDKETT